MKRSTSVLNVDPEEPVGRLGFEESRFEKEVCRKQRGGRRLRVPLHHLGATPDLSAAFWFHRHRLRWRGTFLFIFFTINLLKSMIYLRTLIKKTKCSKRVSLKISRRPSSYDLSILELKIPLLLYCSTCCSSKIILNRSKIFLKNLLYFKLFSNFNI